MSAGACAKNVRAEARSTPDLLEAAGAGGTRHGEAMGVGRDGGKNAPGHAAGGAADGVGTRPPGNDREGEVSGVGRPMNGHCNQAKPT